MTVPRDPGAARARARAARDRLFATLGTVQQRLKPASLAQDAVASARQGVADVAREGARAVRARPWLTAAVAGGAGLVLARGWIADILRHRRAARETPGSDKGSVQQSGNSSKG